MRLHLVLLFSILAIPMFADVYVRIDSKPSGVGARFKVTGANCQPGEYAAGIELRWTGGPACQVEFLLPLIVSAGEQYVFDEWDDHSSSPAISVPVLTGYLFREIKLKRRVLVTVKATPPEAGSVTGGGWYTALDPVTFHAIPNPGYAILWWNYVGEPVGVFDQGPSRLWLTGRADAPMLMEAKFVPITPLPRRYEITRLPHVYATTAGALNADGLVAAIGDPNTSDGSTVLLWKPERPNSAMGSYADPGEFRRMPADFSLLLNNEGGVVYSEVNSTEVRHWAPALPGSATGVETTLTEQKGRLKGVPYAFNNFGQIAGSFGLWTPDVKGALTGNRVGLELGHVVRAMNDYGQLALVPARNFIDARAAGFHLFTPSQPNSPSGVDSWIYVPAGNASVDVKGMNARGDVVGSYCVPDTPSSCASHGFLWRPTVPNTGVGEFVEFVLPAGYTRIFGVTATNNLGDVVGTIVDKDGYSTPFLWTAGVIYNLIQSPGVYPSLIPIGLNDAGQILLRIPNGYEIYLLTPQISSPPPPSNAVDVTINGGGNFTVSGTGCQAGDYSAPTILQWTPGASCQIRWTSAYSTGTWTRNRFTVWSDGPSANPRTFTAPSTPTTYTASFQEEFFVCAFVLDPTQGRATGSGWYPRGAIATLTVIPAPGYIFDGWRSGIDDSPQVQNTLQVTVTQSVGYLISFAAKTALPYAYGVTKLNGSKIYSARLNNVGQVIYYDPAEVSSVTLWNPTESNGTVGRTTTLNGFAPQTQPLLYSMVLALNDRGQIARASKNLPFQLWSPSTSNGTQGTYSTIAPPPSSEQELRLTAINGYGQVFATFQEGADFWTPTSSNGSTGELTTLEDRGSTLGANDFGQIVLQSESGTLKLFTPTVANGKTGAYSSIPAQLSMSSGGPVVAINSQGAIAANVGYVPFLPYTDTRAFLSTPDSPNGSTGSGQVLPLPDGYNRITAIAINNKNEVAGMAIGPNRKYSVPFVYLHGEFYGIEDFPGLPSIPIFLGFNDAGQLLLSNPGATALYLLTPQTSTGPCTITTTRQQETIGNGGGRATISIAAASNCSWTATVADPWLSINGAASGVGNGIILVDVAPNTAGVARTSSVSINTATVTIRQALLPTVSFSPSSLRIVVGPTGNTGPQEVQVRVSGAGAVTGAVSMAPASAQVLGAAISQSALPASLTVSYQRGTAAPVSTTANITLTLTGADQVSVTLPVTIEVQPAGTPAKPPFGYFDTPANNATNLAGSFAVTGWAMDDIGVERVEIWRDRVGNEPVAGNGLVYIGVGTFVPDTRSDIERLYPSLPLNRRAGWGYMLLTNTLPNGGNGTYTLEAIAVDTEGSRTSLGRKTVTINNAASKKPFGAIDAPGPGATISGAAYLNTGWALTPKPSTIPRDGHTITMDIDGVPQGTVTYNQFRGDIASIFPGYNNGSAGGGSMIIDTTKLANGMHSISWVVYDDQGNGDGVGSRYFYASNPGITAASEPSSPRSSAMAAYDGDRINAALLDRVEFQLPAGGTDSDWEGSLIVDGEKRSLPVGSTLDTRHGRFYWRVGPGYRGDYDLEFTNRATGATHRVTVGVAHSKPERIDR